MNKVVIIAVILLLLKHKKKGSVVIHDWNNAGYPMPLNTATLLYNDFVNSEWYNYYFQNYIRYVESNGGFRQEKKINGLAKNKIQYLL